MKEAVTYYFCYGSNLMTERMQIENKTAKFVGIGRVKKHRLVFTSCDVHVNRWGGSVASIFNTGDDSDEVWGSVYTIETVKMDKLANQESDYKQVPVQVELADGRTFDCVSYVHHKQVGESAQLPGPESVPSVHYLSVLVYGAKQKQLPESYLNFLINHPRKVPKCNVDIFAELVDLSGGALKLIE